MRYAVTELTYGARPAGAGSDVCGSVSKGTEADVRGRIAGGGQAGLLIPTYSLNSSKKCELSGIFSKLSLQSYNISGMCAHSMVILPLLTFLLPE